MAQSEVEQWFIKRGVPHFISSYNAAEDVLTRAVPLLVTIFLFSAVSAIDLDWPAWGIGLAVVAGLAILISGWVMLNRMRGRPSNAPPDRVGRTEVAVFLLLPTLLPLVFGGDMAGSAATFVTLLVILGVVYVVTSYGLLPLSIWAVRQVIRTIGQTFTLFTRSLPLLLLGFMFLFVNAEAWQSAGQLDQSLVIAIMVLFGLLAAVFLLTQIPREMAGLNRFESWHEAVAWADDAPIDPAGDSASIDEVPLRRRERGNVFLVFFFSQALRVSLVSSLVGLFFVMLGLVIIRPETIELWTGEPPDVVWELSIAGVLWTLTEELLQVSGFLAAFASLYFSVYTTTDQTLRSDFFEDTVAEVRQNLAVRAIYRTGSTTETAA